MNIRTITTTALISLGALAPMACLASPDDSTGRFFTSMGYNDASATNARKGPGDYAPRALALGAGATANERTREWTIWILSWFGVEYAPRGSNFSVGLGFNGVVTNSFTNKEGNSEISDELAYNIELGYYSNSNCTGLMYSLRVGQAEGVDGNSSSTFVAPGLYYISRPLHGGADFKIGASFPIGGGIVPFSPGVNIGWSF
jgi:hypothetical protein